MMKIEHIKPWIRVGHILHLSHISYLLTTGPACSTTLHTAIVAFSSQEMSPKQHPFRQYIDNPNNNPNPIRVEF